MKKPAFFIEQIAMYRFRFGFTESLGQTKQAEI
jgi:hypothetical protein